MLEFYDDYYKEIKAKFSFFWLISFKLFFRKIQFDIWKDCISRKWRFLLFLYSMLFKLNSSSLKKSREKLFRIAISFSGFWVVRVREMY